jgi:hypothetical protein
MSKYNHFNYFAQINSEWFKYMNYTDTYNMIKSWVLQRVPENIDNYTYHIIVKSKLDILNRIESNVEDGKETNSIVDDFIYGDMYLSMRNEMFDLVENGYSHGYASKNKAYVSTTIC